MFKYNEHCKILNRLNIMITAELEYEILNDALEAFKNEIQANIPKDCIDSSFRTIVKWR